MSKHTPEPWVADYRHDLETNFYSDDATGSIIGGCQEYMFAHRDIEERRANARRIVTCINACAGMADPAAEIAELKRQRDELLALAERLVRWDLDYPVNCYNGYAGLQALNAIIRDNKVAIAKGSAS